MEIPPEIKKWIEDEAEKKFPGVKAFYMGTDYEMADSIADRKVGFIAGATSLYQHLQENGRVAELEKEVEEYSRNLKIATEGAIKLATDVHELRKRLDAGRHFLMGVSPKDLKVEDALVAFGWASNGLSELNNL